MRILLTPMSNLTTSYGAMTRCISIALKAKQRGHTPIIAAGKDDVNQEQMQQFGIEIIEAPVPIPFGLPRFLGKVLAWIISRVEIPSDNPDNAMVKTFEQALFITGATRKSFFKKDALFLAEVIKNKQIDMLYSEFRLSGIVAAKLAGIPSITSYGKPESSEMGKDVQYAKDVNTVLKELAMPAVASSLDIFHWADYKVVPSSKDFEQFEDENGVVYTGPLIYGKHTNPKGEKKYIIVYLGLAVFPSKKIVKTCIEAFKDLPYKVIIGARELKECDIGNVCVRKYVVFEDYFPESLVFINHGGQNSCMTGILNAVAQINFPGFIYERRYNAKGAENAGAGIFCEKDAFNPQKLRELVKRIEKDPSYAENAMTVKQKMLKLGGSDT
ncbi:MAG: hypothetical protein KAQ68_01920, partial [Clostridiales bacterium]|nr:hypothetical protein [Clostridiales bacterium]